MVTSIHPEAHAIVSAVGDGVKGKCTKFFPKYSNESNFLIGNELYIYKEEDLFS